MAELKSMAEITLGGTFLRRALLQGVTYFFSHLTRFFRPEKKNEKKRKHSIKIKSHTKLKMVGSLCFALVLAQFHAELPPESLGQHPPKKIFFGHKINPA